MLVGGRWEVGDRIHGGNRLSGETLPREDKAGNGCNWRVSYHLGPCLQSTTHWLYFKTLNFPFVYKLLQVWDLCKLLLNVQAKSIHKVEPGSRSDLSRMKIVFLTFCPSIQKIYSWILFKLLDLSKLLNGFLILISLWPCHFYLHLWQEFNQSGFISKLDFYN